MFAGLHDQQQVTGHQPFKERLRQSRAWLFRDVRAGNDGRQQIRIPDRSKIDEPHAIGEAPRGAASGLLDQSCLPTAAGTSHGDEAVRGNQRQEFLEFRLATHEASEVERQVGGWISNSDDVAARDPGPATVSTRRTGATKRYPRRERSR